MGMAGAYTDISRGVRVKGLSTLRYDFFKRIKQ